MCVQVLLLASTEASRPLGPKSAALASIYDEIPVHIVELAAATRHLLQKADVKKPASPKSVKIADSATRAFTRLSKKAPKRSSFR